MKKTSLRNFILLLLPLLIYTLEAATITVGGRENRVSDLFYGINSLYWVDTDATRNDPRYLSAIKEAKVSLIRYPGGEVADNFEWDTNRLNNPKSFPYEKSRDASRVRMDFDEFIEWKNRIGAEAILVVNLEQGFIEGNLEKAAQKAADWVRYANIEKKYHIHYWEIGNESYHLGTRYALTAHQYAKALKLFSRKMKAVDPTIKIGAIGPWDYRAVPLIEYLAPEEIAYLHTLRTPRERKLFRRKFRKTFRHDSRKSSWWKVVADEAGDAFDFAVVHRYTPRRKTDADLSKPLECGSDMLKLKEFLKRETGRNYPIAVTEYNVARRSAKRLSTIALDLTIAEMMGEYLKAGVKLANYWPFRYRDKRSLIGMENMRRKPLYHVFSLYSNYGRGELLHSKTDDPELYTIAFRDRDGYENLFVLNKGKERSIEVKLPRKACLSEKMIIQEGDLIPRKTLFKSCKESRDRLRISSPKLSVGVWRFYR